MKKKSLKLPSKKEVENPSHPKGKKTILKTEKTEEHKAQYI